MIEIAAASAAIGAITSSVELVDKVYDTWVKFRESGEVEKITTKDHFEIVTSSDGGKSLVHMSNGVIAKKITREQLADVLERTDLMVLEALEKKMELLVAKWSSITSAFETLTPAQQGASRIQLDDICVDLSKCLSQTMLFLEKLGFELNDHYASVKMIAETR